MSGRVGRSGRPPKPIALHLRDGSYRADRHQRLIDDAARATPASPPRISPALRRAALRDLPTGPAREIVLDALREYGDWTRPGVETLRCYAQSCGRLAALSTAGNVAELRRETRLNLQLLRALDLEPQQ